MAVISNVYFVGLCRSSEIFGVGEFVVGSIRHTKEKAFENLSVTAHKWIPIKEVIHVTRTYSILHVL